MKRKSISKKLRFEVYKRDKFTCQYCGKKAPDIILNIDHIEPVASGGTNEILNLITSCFECNNGKSDILLEDHQVMDKQRQQLENLQERREQIEMMFDWKKSLENLDNFTGDLLVEYIESKISPYTLNEHGKFGVVKILKKFEIDKIFDAVDKGVKTYLKYDHNNKLTQESVENFINKIGGIASYSAKPLAEQKLHYIKGICRNRFNYWDDRVGLSLLNAYVKALRDYGWTEEKILNDLETEAGDLAKTANNWSAWKSQMETWIDEIRKWEKEDNSESDDDYELSMWEIEDIADTIIHELGYVFQLIDYLYVPFGIKKPDDEILINSIIQYLGDQIEVLKTNPENIEKLKPNWKICKELNLLGDMVVDSGLTYMIDDMYLQFIVSWVERNLYLPTYEMSKEKDMILFMQHFKRTVSANKQGKEQEDKA